MGSVHKQQSWVTALRQTHFLLPLLPCSGHGNRMFFLLKIFLLAFGWRIFSSRHTHMHPHKKRTCTIKAYIRWKLCVHKAHTQSSNYWPTILLTGQKANSNWLESAHISVSSNITVVYYSITALNMQIHTGIKKRKEKKRKSDSSASPHPPPFLQSSLRGRGSQKRNKQGMLSQKDWQESCVNQVWGWG